MANEEIKHSLENHNFYICSILMRRVCSSQGFSVTEVDAQTDHINYFNLLLNICLKNHKSKMKELKKGASKIRLSSFHVDFIKTLIFYAAKLNEKYDMKIDSVKYCGHFFTLYIHFSKSVFEFEFDYLNKFSLDNESSGDQIQALTQANENEMLAYMTRSICVSINTLSLEQFKSALESFEKKMLEHLRVDGDVRSKNCLLKLAQLVKYMCSEFELDDKLKPEFSTFIQKFLVQIHPIYFSLKCDNEIECLIDLLNAQYVICSSKYVRSLVTIFELAMQNFFLGRIERIFERI